MPFDSSLGQIFAYLTAIMTSHTHFFEFSYILRKIQEKVIDLLIKISKVQFSRIEKLYYKKTTHTVSLTTLNMEPQKCLYYVQYLIILVNMFLLTLLNRIDYDCITVCVLLTVNYYSTFKIYKCLLKAFLMLFIHWLLNFF